MFVINTYDYLLQIEKLLMENSEMLHFDKPTENLRDTECRRDKLSGSHQLRGQKIFQPDSYRVRHYRKFSFPCDGDDDAPGVVL